MKEIDNTPIESFDQDWGDPDGTGKKAKSLEQVQAFLKKHMNNGYKYISTATPSTTPVTLTGDEKVFFIATEEGDYTSFGLGNISELSIIKSENGSWKTEGLGVPMDIAELEDRVLALEGSSLEITNIELVSHPARSDGSVANSGAFKGYKVDLSNYSSYQQVYFKGSNGQASTTIVRGVIIDKEGNVESYVPNEVSYSTEWQSLPITENSSYLLASYVVDGQYVQGIETWTPEYVEVKAEGIADKVSELEDRVLALEGSSLEITNIELVSHPARSDGSVANSGAFKGYKVDLSNYSSYQQVYFKGSNGQASTTIVRGVIIDKEGNVESYVPNEVSYSTEWQSLPITENSSYLLASYVVDGQYVQGMETWTPEYVEVKAEGIADKVSELEDRVLALEGSSLVNVHLPSDIYILKNKTSQLFFRGFIEAVDPYIYDIKVKCAIGKTFRRYYEITPAQIGDYPFTLEVRDDNRNIIGSAISTIHVVEKTAGVLIDKNVLCVGASATATGYWPSEIKRMSESMSLNLNYVGRLVGSADNSVNLEAIGGWTWGTFIHSGVTCIRFFISGGSGDLTINSKLSVGDTIYTVLEINLTEGVGNIRCAGATQYTNASEPSSPQGVLQAEGVSYNYTSFVKENFVPFPNGDFTEYADTYCNGRIDIMMIHMGVNSMLREYSAIPENDIKDFLDGYFNSFPDGKVLFAAIPMPDYGSNVYTNTNTDNNINRYGTLHSFMEYNDYMYHLSQDDYKGRLLYCPGNIFFDTDYGYPKTQKNVNTRISAIKETIDTNGVHPIAEGSYLIADSILPVLIKILEP